MACLKHICIWLWDGTKKPNALHVVLPQAVGILGRPEKLMRQSPRERHPEKARELAAFPRHLFLVAARFVMMAVDSMSSQVDDGDPQRAVAATIYTFFKAGSAYFLSGRLGAVLDKTPWGPGKESRAFAGKSASVGVSSQQPSAHSGRAGAVPAPVEEGGTGHRPAGFAGMSSPLLPFLNVCKH